MTMMQIEDAIGTTAEINPFGADVELNLTSEGRRAGLTSVSIVLTPRQARALARQLLEQADAAEYGEDED